MVVIRKVGARLSFYQSKVACTLGICLVTGFFKFRAIHEKIAYIEDKSEAVIDYVVFFVFVIDLEGNTDVRNAFLNTFTGILKSTGSKILALVMASLEVSALA